jgi:hypothetical protein
MISYIHKIYALVLVGILKVVVVVICGVVVGKQNPIIESNK